VCGGGCGVAWGGKWGGGIGGDKREGREGGGSESERGGGRGGCTHLLGRCPAPSYWEDAPAPSLSTSLLLGLTEGLTLGSV
jgi:hypothetical protein